jgi:SRSO17 transposase
VGVAPQYCGELGKKANGQVVVTIQYADPYYAWPVTGQLYLTEEWCQDQERRGEAGIPAEVEFQTKPALALTLLDEARQWGVPFGGVVSDSGYGDNPTFVEGLETRGIPYVVQVACSFGVRLLEEVAAAARHPLPAKKKEGRPRKHPHPLQVAALHRADEVLASQPEGDWKTITWRLGSDGPLTKQFVAVRVHRAVGEETGPEGWLMGERPLPGKEGEQKFYFSTYPADVPLARLAEIAHRRPSVERGYEDGKDFTGLGDYAARRWNSFHRQLAIEMLTLSWLVLQRPPAIDPVIEVEPRPVSTANEPVFPLRSGTVHQCRTNKASGL